MPQSASGTCTFGLAVTAWPRTTRPVIVEVPTSPVAPAGPAAAPARTLTDSATTSPAEGRDREGADASPRRTTTCPAAPLRSRSTAPTRSTEPSGGIGERPPPRRGRRRSDLRGRADRLARARSPARPSAVARVAPGLGIAGRRRGDPPRPRRRERARLEARAPLTAPQGTAEPARTALQRELGGDAEQQHAEGAAEERLVDTRGELDAELGARRSRRRRSPRAARTRRLP